MNIDVIMAMLLLSVPPYLLIYLRSPIIKDFRMSYCRGYNYVIQNNTNTVGVIFDRHSEFDDRL